MHRRALPYVACTMHVYARHPWFLSVNRVELHLNFYVLTINDCIQGDKEGGAKGILNSILLVEFNYDFNFFIFACPSPLRLQGSVSSTHY